VKSGRYIVVDIGKTLAKVSLWSADGCLLDRQTRANRKVELDGIARLDAGGIADWLPQALAKYAGNPIAAIIPVAHGAGVVALKRQALAFAPIDYEADLPDELPEAYRAARNPYTLTGSPALPAGLNLGAQLYWLEHRSPGCLRGCTLLPWAQYWSWFLSGVATTEVTSLGCHSDLWIPSEGRFSPLAVRSGWADRFAPIVTASEAIGTIRTELADATGLPAEAVVHAGLHDSNAALLAARGFSEFAKSDLTVLSTGTWFVCMRVPLSDWDAAKLDEKRDCLINVDPFGNPIPSARFMGGREIESLIEIDTRRVDIKPDQPHLLEAVDFVVESRAMVLPTLAEGTGPFPHHQGGWINRPVDWFSRRAGACLYAALVADTSLNLIGSKDALLVEGRFAEAEVFIRALAALRPASKVFAANEHNDVALGALRLIDPELAPAGALRRIEPLADDITSYRAAWTSRIGVPA